MEIGTVIKDIRKRKKITLKELSEEAQITEGYLSRIENNKSGQPRPDTIKSIAKGLKVDSKYLMEKAGYEEEGAYNERIDKLLDMAAERNKKVHQAEINGKITSTDAESDFIGDGMANFPDLNAKKIILNVPKIYNVQDEVRETQTTDALDLYYLSHLAKQDNNINLKYNGKDLNKKQIQKAVDMLNILFRED